MLSRSREIQVCFSYWIKSVVDAEMHEISFSALTVMNQADTKPNRQHLSRLSLYSYNPEIYFFAFCFYRASYASAVLGVEILSVRPSVTRVLCD